MWYVFMFAGLAILCVVVVLIRNARVKAGRDTTPSTHAEHEQAHREQERAHAEQERAHRERKRRRAQSKADRRKRH